MIRQTSLATALLALAAAPAVAQAPPAVDIPDKAAPVAWSEVGESARSLLGAQAVDRTGAELGEVEDLLLTEGGMAYAFVLQVGGTLGLGGRLVAAPAVDVEVTSADRIELDVTAEQLKARTAFDYDDVRLTMFAPIGFGAETETDAMRERGVYLTDWSDKVDRWSEKVGERAASMSEEAEAEIESAWTRVQDEWGRVRQASSRNWGRATETFESAWQDFRDAWKEATPSEG